MEFYHITEEKSYTGKQLRANFPNTSFPNVLRASTILEHGFVPVLETAKPAPTSDLHIIRRDGVTQNINGDYIQAWQEVDRHSDILDGQTKEEQDTVYFSKLAAKAEIVSKKDDVAIARAEYKKVKKTATIIQKVALFERMHEL